MTQAEHKRDIKYSSDQGYPWEDDIGTEPEINEPEPKEKAKNNFGEFVYGKSLKWYKDVAIWPMFILLIVEIGIRVMQSKYLLALEPEIFTWSINLVRVALFVYLTISAIRQFKANKKQTLTAAVIGGMGVGIILAVFQLFWYFEIWAFFNLIGQPLMLALEGLIVGWVIITVFYPSLKKNQKDRCE